MKKLILLWLAAAAVASGQQVTPNIGLLIQTPPQYANNWGAITNYNFQKIDTAFAGVGSQWKGAWISSTAYVAGNFVSYLGNYYLAIQSSTNQNPVTQTAYWVQVNGSGDTGTVTDNTGTTTANQLALSTSTAHQITYGSALPNGTTATTQTTGDNSTKVATDQFVIANAGSGGGGVQYNPESTAHIFLTWSGLYDDNHSLTGASVPVASVSSSAGIVTVTTSSAHGISAGGWVDASTITGWPCGSQAAGCGSFQVLSTGLTSTQLEFAYSGSVTCVSSCGLVYNASFWALAQTSNEPFFAGHGTITGIEQSLQTVAASPSTYINCNLGTPTYLWIEQAQDDIANSESEASIKGYFQTIWAYAHAHGCIVNQGSVLAANYGFIGSNFSVWSITNDLNIWLPQQTNGAGVATGQYWDKLIDYPSYMNFEQNIAGVGVSNASFEFAELSNEALSSQGGKLSQFPLFSYIPGDSNQSILVGNSEWKYMDVGNLLFADLDFARAQWKQYQTNASNGPLLQQYTSLTSPGEWCAGTFIGIDNGTNDGFSTCFGYAGSGSSSNYWGMRVGETPSLGALLIKIFANGNLQFPLLTGLPGSGYSVGCYDSSGNLVLGVCGSSSSGTVTYTSSQTAANSDNGKVVVFNCSGACSYTLPATQPSTTWSISLQSIGSTTATVVLGGSDTFNGSTAIPALNKYRLMKIAADTGTATNYVGEAPLVMGANMDPPVTASNGFTLKATTQSSGGAGLATCSDTSGSGAAQTCTLSGSTSFASSMCFLYTTSTANTGALTLNINSFGALPVKKWLYSTALASGDLAANSILTACVNAAQNAINIEDIANPPSGGGGGVPAFPFTVIQEFKAVFQNESSDTLTFPFTAQASGSTLELVVANDGCSGTTTTPSGWTKDFDTCDSFGNTARIALFHIASSSQTSVTVATSTTESQSMWFFELAGSRTFDHSAVSIPSSGSSYLGLPFSSLTPSVGSAIFATCSYPQQGGLSNGGNVFSYPMSLNPSWRGLGAYNSNASEGRSLIGWMYSSAGTGALLQPPPVTLSFQAATTSYACESFSIL